MLFAGVLLLLLASVLLSWCVGHARLPSWERAGAFRGFHMLGFGLWVIGLLALILGLGLIWGATSFLGAASAALAYFFLLPFLTQPLLRALGALPALDLAPNRKGRIAILSAMEKSYFEHKYRYPGTSERFHLFSALRARYIEKSEEKSLEIAWRCASLDDAMVEAARIDAGDEAAEEVRLRLHTFPKCSKCGEHRAFRSGDPLCYGCREYGNLKVCHRCDLYWAEDDKHCRQCGQPLSDVASESQKAKK